MNKASSRKREPSPNTISSTQCHYRRNKKETEKYLFGVRSNVYVAAYYPPSAGPACIIESASDSPLKMSSNSSAAANNQCPIAREDTRGKYATNFRQAYLFGLQSKSQTLHLS